MLSEQSLMYYLSAVNFTWASCPDINFYAPFLVSHTHYIGTVDIEGLV